MRGLSGPAIVALTTAPVVAGLYGAVTQQVNHDAAWFLYLAQRPSAGSGLLRGFYETPPERLQGVRDAIFVSNSMQHDYLGFFARDPRFAVTLSCYRPRGRAAWFRVYERPC